MQHATLDGPMTPVVVVHGEAGHPETGAAHNCPRPWAKGG
jgi:hypothetical protein